MSKPTAGPTPYHVYELLITGGELCSGIWLVAAPSLSTAVRVFESSYSAAYTATEFALTIRRATAAEIEAYISVDDIGDSAVSKYTLAELAAQATEPCVLAWGEE
jgi:hypothetical protein